MKKINSYQKLKNSNLDSSVDSHYDKIDIDVFKKYTTKKQTLRIKYCSLGILNCSSIKDTEKPCLTSLGCPYKKVKIFEQPHKNSKKYLKFVEELNLHMTQKELHEIWDKDIENVLNNNYTKEEKDRVIEKIVSHFEEFHLQKITTYHEIFKEAYILMIKLKKEEKSKRKKLKKNQVLFEIGDYFYIKINHMKNIRKNDTTSIWYNLDYSGGLVRKDYITKNVIKELEKPPSLLQEDEREQYLLDIEMLKNELELKYFYLH